MANLAISNHNIEFNRLRNHLTLEIAIMWRNKTNILRGDIIPERHIFMSRESGITVTEINAIYYMQSFLSPVANISGKNFLGGPFHSKSAPRNRGPQLFDASYAPATTWKISPYICQVVASLPTKAC
jgi:hypothetical protein